MGRTFFTRRAMAALVGSVLLAGCTVHKQETPSLSGPSGLGASLVITVSPDVLVQDGASQSLVQIQAYDSNGQPARNKSMRVEIRVDGDTTDFGRLSAKNVVTDQNGRASVTYTAPAPIQGIASEVPVQIAVTPSESDFGNATTRYVTIRIVPGGVFGPGTSPLKPDFTVPAATVGNPAVFTGTVTTSDTTAQVASLVWDFGDGSTATGQTAQHTFSTTGTFLVTLGLTDTLGRTASATHSVTVGQGAVPIASFLASPSSPNVGQTVNFNASGSTAEIGHRITEFSWNFGDGNLGTGALTTHAYSQAGSYTVTLKVTDDVGRKSSLVSQTIAVGSGGPTAAFTFSPSSPATNQPVNFDGSLSSGTAGRSIVSYAWDFDDGTRGSGAQTSHVYTTGGTYSVRLTVTDSVGQTATTTQNVTVGSGAPTADFNFSPTQPAANQPIAFDASPSRTTGGRTIVSYVWDFDDATTGTGIQTSHAYATARIYSVRLTITDSAGQTGSITKPVTVSDTGTGPVAKFEYSPTGPAAGQTVFFDARQSTASQGATISTYSWTFGDGTTGTGVQPTHVFATPGTYIVRLTITDSANRTATSSQNVTIR